MDLCVFCPSWEVEDIPPCPLTAHKRNMCIQQAARQSNSKVCSPSGTGGMREFTFLISRGRTGLITIRLWTRTAHMLGQSDSFAAGKLLSLPVKCDGHHLLRLHFPVGCVLCYCTELLKIKDTISYWDEHSGSLIVGFLCSGLDLITCANCIIQTQILATDRKLNDV